jgi:CNT family concentrative nucleoside transporter
LLKCLGLPFRGPRFVTFLQALSGFVLLHVIAWAVSENRRAIPWRPVLAGAALTVLLAAAFLKIPAFTDVFLLLNRAVAALDRATQAGASFVFGFLGGGESPYEERAGMSSFVLAFRALPIVLVISALSALLFHWRILPWIVRGFAAVLRRTLGLGGAVGLAAAANVFVGMVEAPLFVRPYLARMTRSELFVTMTCGMATIAGTVMVLYATLLARTIPDALAHILIASIIATPAAVAIAVLMVPGDTGRTDGEIVPQHTANSSMDAITRGTLEGAALLVNIVAMLLVLVALVHLANAALSLLPPVAGAALTLQRMLGWVMAPLVWLAGIPWHEAPLAGSLMGTKTILNEFVAYVDLSQLPPEALSPRSRLIMTYALCGFANLGSLGIMIGGLATLAPERRAEIVSLGGRTLVSGTLATLVAAAAVAMLI